MVVGIQMVSFAHIRKVHRHREFLVYGATISGVILAGVLEGVAIGIVVAVAVALHRLARTRITVTEQDGRYLVTARGQLTFLAVPRLSRLLGRLPHGVDAVVELDGFFMDHAAYETIQDWYAAQTAMGGHIEFTGRSGGRIAEPASAAHSCCRPWTPWRNHHCHDGGQDATTTAPAPPRTSFPRRPHIRPRPRQAHRAAGTGPIGSSAGSVRSSAPPPHSSVKSWPGSPPKGSGRRSCS